MRHDRLYLTDIVEAADHLTQFLAGADFPAFQVSELLRSAVVQKLAVIGEAAARVSDELKTRHPHIPWLQIIAFRNILIHAYFGIDWDVVWRAARNRCPSLRKQVADILAAESADTAEEEGGLIQPVKEPLRIFEVYGEAQSTKSVIEPEAKLKSIRQAAQYSFPTADVEQMLSEIERGHDA